MPPPPLALAGGSARLTSLPEAKKARYLAENGGIPMPRKPNTPCARCARLCWPSKKTGDPTWIAPREHVCHDCRRAAMNRCLGCSLPIPRNRKRCGPCHSADFTYDTSESRKRGKVARDARDAAAVGHWTRAKRNRLVAKWQARGVPCFYCGGTVSSADHVVPLSRGGTNHEGNLIPCCVPCNRSKSAMTIMEWRMRKARKCLIT